MMGKRSNSFANNVLIFLLAFSMILCQIPVDAFAESGTLVLKMNDADMTLSAAGDFSVAKKVKYGDSMVLTLEPSSGYSGDAEFLYVAGDSIPDGSTSWEIWTSDKHPTEPGNYYLGYQASVNNETVFKADSTYGFTIEKAQLAAPAGAAWSGGSKAEWSAVTKSASGTDLDSGAVSGYQVKLSKDGKESKTVTTTETSYDFTDDIKAASGDYTFTVAAVSGAAAHYTDSESSASSGTTKSVAITVSKDNGITSVSPESAILISGNTTYNSETFAAVVKSGRTFGSWSSSDAGLTIADPANESTKVSVPADYSGEDAVTLSVSTVDKTAPTIKSFTAGTGDKYGYLQGTAGDSGGGIAAYAFSTKADKGDLLESDWTVLGTAEENASCEQKVSAAGKYYFYVKDSSGNITGSSDPIQATEVIYHDYYSDNNKTDKTDYMVGSGALTLADISGARYGYDFGGWYKSSDFSGSDVTEISTQSDSAVNVYAKWTREVVKISAQPQGVETTYDGKNHELSVSVANATGVISYQWFKDGTKIEGATSANYNVKNVSDSGSYKVRVTVTLDSTDVIKDSDEAVVAIGRKDLTITAADKTAVFGDPAPDYSFTASGFADSEDTGVLTAGTYDCSYTQGSHAGQYAITPRDFSAANYQISYVPGTLNVSAKAITGLDISLEKSSCTYTGGGIEPAVIVKDGGTDVDSKNYTVSYTDNVNQGTAKATVTFQNDYTGEKTLEFTIVKADFSAEASIADWTYGDTAPDPSITNNPGSGKVTYYYASSETGEGTTTKPSDAGTYYIYAVIAATGNYNEYTTPRKSFTIKKRSITFTASTAVWPYDGTSHSSSDYAQSGDTAGSDGFQRIWVEGTITDAGTTANKVRYTLTSSTNANNYDINCIDGTLTVTADALSTPDECSWSSSSAGTAAWIGIVRTGLIVSYNVQLYRVGTETAIAEADTTDDSYDFSKAIKDDCTAQGQTGQYYFKVKAVPYGGVNLANYTSSADSDASLYINTIKLTTGKTPGIASLTGVAEGTSYLIRGETVDISAALDTGYSFADPVWTCSGAISVADPSKSATTITASSLLTSSAEATLNAYSSDDLPVIGSFEAAYAEDGSVTLSLNASDSKAVTAWAITNSSDTPADTEWRSVAGSQTGITESMTINAKGTYYAWVKDGTNVVGGDKYKIAIYKIDFDGNGGTGTMSSLLKIQNKALTLPANTYAKEGYIFQTWKGSTGSYGDGKSYAANSDDTLSAQWSNQRFNYNVEYYYMDTDGSYLTAPSETKTFEGSYGDVISSDSETISQSKAGMSLDTSRPDSITLTGSGKVLKVYYQRNKYTITYSYTKPGDAAATSQSVDFYYNQSVTEVDKPSVEGYTFVGWEYDDFGTKPATMPLRNIKASGSFTANEAKYNINYYEKNLTGDDYTLVDSATETRSARHDDKITFANNDANCKAFEGFSVEGITVSSGAAGGSAPSGMQTSVTATISAIAGQTTNINYYYTRNSYKLTLNVYKDNRVTNIYSHPSEVLYGTPINASEYANYGQSDWTKNRTDMKDYVLASYADWSTGSAPATMPAADITVSRDYEKNLGSFLVEVYYEQGSTGHYVKQSTLAYYAAKDSNVTVGNSSSDTVNFEDFKNYISDFSQYEYDSGNANNVTSGTVASDGSTTLKVYFKGKQTSTTVNYYYRSGTESILMGSVVITGNVGMNYTYDPALLFKSVSGTPAPVEGTYTSGNKTINGVSAESYDFLSNNYVIYASGYYYNGEGNWPGGGYIYTADGLTTKTATFGYGETALGKDYANRMNIYYTPVPHETQYYLNVVHTPYSYLTKAPAGDKNLPLTVVYGGTTYKIRVTNESNIYQAAWENDTTRNYSGYPGGTVLNGKWKVADPKTLRTGWNEVNIDGQTYYTNDNDDGDYIYLADTSNQFYEGHYVSYNFLDAKSNPNKLGYSTVEDYLANYKSSHNDDADADLAYIYNGNYYGFMSDNGTYTFTYRYKTKYSLTYYLSGQYKTVDYAQGTEVTPETDSSIFSAKDGCTIAWYTDSAFTTPATKFTISSDTMLYGRYERNTVTYHKYAYYQLGDPINIGGISTSYITKDNIGSLSSDITSESTSETISFTDGVGKVSNKTVSTTKYYYKGSLVMTDVESPVLTYTEVSIDPADAKYVVSGYNYEETNANNVLNQTIITDGTSLSIYYARNVHSVVKTTDAAKASTAVTNYYRFGHTVSVDAPKKSGYQFKNWTWKIKDASTGTWSEWTEAPTLAADGSGSFTMPDAALEMTAVWEPADFDATVTHYFQNRDKTYGKDTLKEFAKYSQSFGTVSVDGTDTNACEFSNNGKVVGIAVPETLKTGGDASKLSDYDKVTYYEYNGSESKPSVNSKDAFAVVLKQGCTSEKVVRGDAYRLTGLSAFTYDYTIFEYNNNTATLSGNDTFTSAYGMSLAYYYTRNSYNINAVSKVSDGGSESGATITGTGSYLYRNDAALRAVVPDGYTFKGWYKAEDVLEGYDASDNTKTLDSYKLKADISGVSKVSEAVSYTVKVDDTSNYVAVVDPVVPSAQDNTITISGGNSYKYGYAKSDVTALNANVTTGTYDFVSSYQWYEGDTAIEGATTSAYLIPTGKASGSYNYKCRAVVENKYSGRKIEITSEPYPVTVGTADITCHETDYNGIYDGQAHGIEIAVDKTNAADLGYTIYYSTEKELTADNYLTDGKTEAPEFTDVKLTDGAAAGRTVYYYIHSSTKDYQDANGSGTVMISPKTVTLKAGGTFTKTYDGSKSITGTELTSLEKGSYYTFSGLAAADAAKGYIISCSAEYNDKDVKDANSITLANIKVTDAEGNVNNNYIFSSGYTLKIPGTVTPKELAIKWGSNAFEYNGTAQIPTVSLAEGSEPVTGENVTVKAQGAQTNAGTYIANASFAADDSYDVNNYRISGDSTCSFTIARKTLTITPKSSEVTYDGQDHKITDFDVAGLAAGQTCTAETDKTDNKDAGMYTITARNGKLFSGGKDVTDNYNIVYGSADLVINRKTVTFSGITANNKVYDGSTAAELDVSGLKFEGIADGDDLSLSGLKGTFDTANSGEGKTVTISGAVLAGTSAGNYTLADTGNQTTAAASISKAELTVTAAAVNTTYGDDAAFTSEITGFVNDENKTTANVSGSVIYRIKKDSGGAAAYDKTSTAAGTYDIVLDLSELQAGNYTFKAGDTAQLNVAQREITVAAADGVNITKTYDGTTSAAVPSADYAFANVVNSDKIALTYTAAYNSANVAEANKVIMSGLSIDNANYKLITSTFDIRGSVSKAALTVTADSKSITYGGSAPTYTATYSGLVNKETSAVISGTPAFACAYDTASAEHRGAGKYTITPSGLDSANYAITYADGILTVNKAKITVTADSKSITYGDALPVYTGQYSGFRYAEDTESVITGTPVYTCAADVASAAGTYDITVNVSGLSADNYDFTGAKGTLTISLHKINISGITVSDKTYDGTTNVAASQIGTGNVDYDGILDADKANEGINVTNARYDSKDAGSRTVNFTVGLNDYLKARYTIGTAQSSADSNITSKGLTITADNKTISYGSAAPTYTYKTDGFVTGENVSALSGGIKYDCSYKQNDPVNTYDIIPGGFTSSNYAITYNKGVLTVEKTHLQTPAVSWSTTSPGTVIWTKPAQIGNVAVSGYKLELYKDDGTAPVYTDAALGADAVSKDLLETIRSSGAGKYYVTVTAIASDTDNASKANVADSAAGKSGYKYAAAVSIDYAADTVSQKGKSSISIKDSSAASYVVVAGEQSIPLAATLINETGYSVSSWTADNASLTFSNQTQSGTSVAASANMSYSLSSTAVNITLTLKATAATLSASASANKTSVDYGYQAADAPVLTAAASAVSDNVDSDKYDYTYQWYSKKGPTGKWTIISGAESSQYTMPTGFKAAQAYYMYQCEITAARKDNGEKKTGFTNMLALSVNRIEFKDATVTMGDWEYGQARKSPSTTIQPDGIVPVITYSSDGGTTWSGTIPKDVGNYKVRADYAESVNYKEKIVEDTFAITAAKLAAPANLRTVASDTAPYGKASWSAVTGPKENSGINSDSSISVKYEVSLFRDTEKLTTITTDGTSYDFTSYYTQTGTYTFSVKALATCSNNNVNNCADSDTATGGDFVISKNMAGGTYEKTYDGKAITLTADSTDGAQYQWLCNNTEISGATDKTYDATYVEQNGTYVCRITAGGSIYYSPNHVVNISPLAVTITASSDSKTYDGTALTNGTFTSATLADGDSAACTMTSASTITNVGSVNNTIGSVTIKDDTDKTVYTDGGTNNNYTVTKAAGTLTVSAKGIGDLNAYASDITVAAIADQTYTGSAITPVLVVKYGNDITLVNGTDYTLSYSTNVNVGTVTITITGKGNYSGSITKTFQIVQRKITVTSAAASKTYDGTPLTTSGTGSLTVTTGSLGSGDALNSVNFTGTQTDTGSSDNKFDTLTIYKGTENVTGNYDIISAYGKLTVTKKSLGGGEVSVADIADQTYTGAEIKPVPTVTYAPSGKTALTVSADDYDVTYSGNINKGTAMITITAKDASTNFSGSITKTFQIVPRAITVTSKNESKTYDGTPLTTSGVASLTVTTGSLGSGDALNSVTFTGTQTAAGSSDNTFDILTIYKGTENVTDNYTITPAYGTLTVSARSIEESGGYAKDITVADIADQTYTGAAITPQPVVTCTGLKSAASTTLVKDTDYTVSYSANVNVGTVTITITGKGNYSGSITKTFKIVNADMTVTANDYSGTYDGSAHGISVSASAPSSTATVYYGTEKIDSTNYLDTAKSSTVNPTYTNAGTYTVYYYITADNYNAVKGSKIVTISRKTIGDGSATPAADITAAADLGDKEYTGSAFTPAPTVNYSALPGTDKALKAGTDYTVSYADNTNTGTATMTITGQGNYSGSIVKTFQIVRKSIGGGTSEAASGITVNMDLSDKTYSGSAFTPAAEVKYGETVLKEGTDYTVSYENNTDVGTATVTITGIGKYSGSIVKTFKIVKAGMTVTAENYSGTYDGKAHGISVSANAPASTAVIYYSASELTAENYNKDGSTVNPTYINIGTYKVYYYITADNYNAEKGSKTVTISRKAIGDGSATPLTDIAATADLSDKSFTGSAFTPEPTVKFGDTTLTSGTDYTVSYNNNTGVGTATMTITGQGNYSGTIVWTFRIVKAKMTVSADGYSGIYDGKTHGISVSASAPASTAVIYYSTSELTAANYSTSGSTTKPVFTDAGTYTVYYCAAADDYDAVTGSRTVAISRRPIGNGSAAPAADITATADLSDRAYTGSAFTPAPAVSCSVLPGTDKTLKAGTDYMTTYEHNTNAGTATMTITGQGNYSGTIVMTFNITAKSIGSGTAENYITVSDIADQTYQPAGCEPKPVVKCTGLSGGDRTLVAGKDYTLSYEQNKAVGTATVTITGIGDFSGTITKTFRIIAAEPDYKVNDYTGTYDGSEHSGQVVKPSDDTVVYYSTEPLDENNYLNASQSVPEFKNAGDYTIYYYVTRPNYNAKRGSFKVKIDKMQPTISADPGSFVYDGKPHRIDATTNGDGAISYSNNDQIKAGSYDVIISTAETDNNNAAEITAKLTITKRGITLTADSGSRKYNGSALTADGYKISSGSLAGGDKIASVRISGSQVKAGTSDNTISNAVIRSSNGEDVTSCYDIVYVNGSLEVIKAASASVHKRGGEGTADNGITAVSTNNDSRRTISKTKDKTDNSGAEDGGTNNGTIKKNANNADSSSNMALFNILALVLLIISALYSLLRRKNSMLNKILNTGIAVAGIILTILTFHAGTLVFVNKISIEFAILLAAAVVVTAAGLHHKNEE